jgi:phage FluMu protein Com
MPIEFRCTGCNKLLRTGDHTGGLPAKCPECGAVQEIPDLGSELNIAPKGPPNEQEQGIETNYTGRYPGGSDSGAVMSLVLGLTALMTSCCLPLSFPVALIGFVLGIRSLGSKNPVLAVVGTVVSFLGLLVTLGMGIAMLFSF